MKLLPIMVAGVSFLPLRRAEHAVVAEDIASLLGITEEVATDVLGRGVIHRVIASGCHAKTVRHIHSTAAASDQFGLDESQITDLAISFTLCSMASALQKVPQECEPWDTTYTTHPGEDSAVRHPKEKERRRGRCLAVLHRSPQDWATFNTYFSDSTQLWLALTHQRHIELAQELYTNATQEKIALLQLLHRKAEASFATDAERDRRVEEQLTKLADMVFRFDATQAKLDDSVESFSEGQRKLWDETAQHMKRLLATAVQSAQGDLSQLQRDAVHEISIALSHAADERLKTMALGAQDAITVMYNSTIHGLEVISEHANRHFIASQDMRTQELAQVKHLHEMLEDADRKLEKLAPQLEAFANSIMIQQTHVQQSVELARVQTAKHAQEVQEALSFLNASLSCVVLPSWSSWESSGTMVLDLLSRSPALINRNSYILLPGVQLFIWITSHVLRALWMGLYGFITLLAALLCLMFTGALRPVLGLVQTLWDAPQEVKLVEASEPARITVETAGAGPPSPRSLTSTGIPWFNRMDERPLSELQHRATMQLRRAFSEPPCRSALEEPSVS